VYQTTADRAAQKSSLAKAALAIASRGKPVFPCKPGGKTPLTENGFKDATTNPHKINAWWEEWPNANIGMPTGKASDVFVLDVDPDKGGFETLKALEAHQEPLPRTATVKTGREGLHIYLRYPDDGTVIRNSVGALGPGLDIRGEGGYVLLPPSTTEGAYEWR